MTKDDFTGDAIHDELSDYTINTNPPDDELSEVGSSVYITSVADIEVSSVTEEDLHFIVEGSATLEAYTDMGEGDTWDHSLPMTFTYEFDEDGKIVRQVRRSIDMSSDLHDDYEADFVQSFGHLDLFRMSLSKVQSLLGEPVSASGKEILNGLLYVNVVTTLECYLSDFFVTRIKKDKKLLRKLIETTPKFKEQKINVSDVFGVMDSVEKKANNYLTSLVWHRLEEVRRLYEKVLGVTFPPSIKDLQEAIGVRHELVHRNGRKPDGTEREVTEVDVRNLIKMAQELVEHIEGEWLNKPTSTSSGTA